MQSLVNPLYEKISTLCDHCTPCVLHPHSFFVAWHGVITLVFRSFPSPLSDLKHSLNKLSVLPPEGQGSRWPKMTLAALASNQVLTSLELTSLLNLIKEHSSSLQSATPLYVKRLSIVAYTQQSLETILERLPIPLRGEESLPIKRPDLQKEVSELLEHQESTLSAEVEQRHEHELCAA